LRGGEQAPPQVSPRRRRDGVGDRDAGGVALAAVVAMVMYLMITGMRDSMIYYHTPCRSWSRRSAPIRATEMGLKVGGRVAPGTVPSTSARWTCASRCSTSRTGHHLPGALQGPLPDTFEEGRDVVIEGRFTQDGVFEATTVLTKCGSRYEAAEEDYLS
jgi:cytochrome c-type biogenesis protein CcmE